MRAPKIDVGRLLTLSHFEKNVSLKTPADNSLYWSMIDLLDRFVRLVVTHF
jgi:hypothetical protein